MSGYASNHADIDRALTAGNVAYLAKPVDVDVLLELLAEQSSTRKQQGESHATTV
jgi:ActR/RegA family two-component response regulator